jgi:hypothetical protein
VQAVLNQPIVTDYVPAAKPPWLLLALVIGILAVWAPRDLLPEILVASAFAAAVGMLANWLWCRFSPAPGGGDEEGGRHDALFPDDRLHRAA